MRIYIILFAYIALFEGCSSLIFQQKFLDKEILKKEKLSKRKLSCEEDAKPKSLQYLEQQYRCTSEVEEK